MMGSHFVGGFAPHMSYGMGLFGGWSVVLVGFGILIVVGVIVWALATKHTAPVVQGAGTYAAPATPQVTNAAEEIVRERFARGEIDREEFDRTIATLRTTR